MGAAGKRGLFTATALLILSLPLTAAERPKFPATEVFDRVLAAQESLAWSSSEITKEERAKGEKKATISKGKLISKQGGLARLELTAPSKGLILADGKNLWVELPEVAQVMRYSADKLKQGGNFFLDLAPTIRHYSKASYRRLILPGPGFNADRVSALELQPVKPQQAGFEKLRVWVDQDNWAILQVRMDYGGTQCLVTFEHMKGQTKADVAKDPKLDLDPKLFEYKAPKGFEIFDLDM